VASFVDYQVRKINEEKSAMLAKRVHQKSQIKEKPGSDGVA
jgi:hypothetical protein